MRTLIVLCALGVALLNISSNPFWLEGQLGSLDDESIILANYSDTESQIFHSLAVAPIADATETISPEELKRLKVEGEKATVVNQALVGISNPTAEEFSGSGQDVFLYTVEEGDTMGSIAVKYHVNVNTIRWANGLEEEEIIHPGDTLFILPVTGVKHKVKSGDTIKSIAKKYKAKEEEIIAFNELPANGKIEKGEEIIIPGGRIEEARPQVRSATDTQLAGDTARSFSKNYYSSGGHRFPYGWCTWYVASKRHVPWGGNAGTWLYNAKAYGANTGKKPKKGAIIVTRESRYGHVGIVEKVSGSKITISEMNYAGWGKVSRRTISSKSSVIKGYIY